MDYLRLIPFNTGIGYRTSSSVLQQARELKNYGVNCLISYDPTTTQDRCLGGSRPLQYRELLYILRDIRGGNITFDISEYTDSDEFLNHLKKITVLAKLNDVTIWISGKYRNFRTLYMYTRIAVKHYHKIGIVIMASCKEIDKKISIILKLKLPTMYWITTDTDNSTV